MQINGKYVKWHHIQDLYEQDNKLPGNLRVCPKLSKSHINLSVSDKMKVRLATQVMQLKTLFIIHIYTLFFFFFTY